MPKRTHRPRCQAPTGLSRAISAVRSLTWLPSVASLLPKLLIVLLTVPVTAPPIAAQTPVSTNTPGASLAGSQNAAASLPALFSRYGVRPIDPPTPASDFRAPLLTGGEGALSDFYGNWVVLTFFATWCGPCRTELPTLQRLHEERADQGLVVLGVSIDDPGAPLEQFMQQLNLTFPTLWDQSKQAAAAYRASSIPLTYLVNPEGRLVAVSRGSRDWWELAPMLDAALAAHPVDPDAAPDPSIYSPADEQIRTATVTDPPDAEVRLLDESPGLGEPFELEIRLLWAGNFEEYLPHPPKVHLPEGIVQDGVSATTNTVDGSHQVIYRVALRAEEAGTFALDPVEVRYTPRFESQPMAGQVLGPTVTIAAKAAGPSRGTVIGAISGGLVALLLGGFALRRLRPQEPAADGRTAAYEALNERFEQARGLRLQGNHSGYFLALAALEEDLRKTRGESPDEAAEAALAEAVERARFGGAPPPAEEIESLARRIQRGLDALREDVAKDPHKEIQWND